MSLRLKQPTPETSGKSVEFLLVRWKIECYAVPKNKEQMKGQRLGGKRREVLWSKPTEPSTGEPMPAPGRAVLSQACFLNTSVITLRPLLLMFTFPVRVSRNSQVSFHILFTFIFICTDLGTHRHNIGGKWESFGLSNPGEYTCL